MLNTFARITLTATAIAPVSLTYAWVAYYQGQTHVAVLAIVIAVLLTIVCVLLLAYVRAHTEALPFKVATVEPADGENLGFMLLYLLPLFTDEIAALNWELWFPLLIVFGFVIGTGYGYHFNPLLSLLRWHFYKVTSLEGVTYVLITKKHLRSTTGSLRVGQLTEYILLDLDGR